MKRLLLWVIAGAVITVGYGIAHWMLIDAYNSTLNLLERDHSVGLAISSVGVVTLVSIGFCTGAYLILKESWRR